MNEVAKLIELQDEWNALPIEEQRRHAVEEYRTAAKWVELLDGALARERKRTEAYNRWWAEQCGVPID